MFPSKLSTVASMQVEPVREPPEQKIARVWMNAYGNDAEVALVMAVHQNYGVAVEGLLKHFNAPVNAMDGGCPIVAIAVRNALKSEDRSIVNSLERRGADLLAVDADGRSALWWAAGGSDPELVTSLVYEKPALADCALFFATAQRNTSAVTALLAAGAKANGRDDIDETPLFYAIRNDDLATVRALLEGGADPDEYVLGCVEYTPLMLAVMNKNPEMVEMLLKHGACEGMKDFNLDSRGNAWTARSYAEEILDIPTRDAILALLDAYLPWAREGSGPDDECP